MKGFSRRNRQEKPLGPSLCNELLLIMALAPSAFPPASTKRQGRAGEAICRGDSPVMSDQDTVPPSRRRRCTKPRCRMEQQQHEGTTESGGAGGDCSVLGWQGESVLLHVPEPWRSRGPHVHQIRRSRGQGQSEGKVEELTWMFLSPKRSR